MQSKWVWMTLIRRYEAGGVANRNMLDGLGLEIEAAGLEPVLSDAILQCIAVLKSLASEAQALHEQIARNEQAFLRTRANIFEESRPE
jgi:hypothetical protein